MLYVVRRPVTSSGNSWADRVRGVQQAASRPVTAVNNMSDNCTTQETDAAAARVPTDQQSEPVTATLGKLSLTAVLLLAITYCRFVFSDYVWLHTDL